MLLQVSKHHENEIDMKLKHSNRFAWQYLLACRHIFHLDSETKVLTEDRWHTYVALFEECGFEVYETMGHVLVELEERPQVGNIRVRSVLQLCELGERLNQQLYAIHDMVEDRIVEAEDREIVENWMGFVTLGLYRNRSVRRIKGDQATFDNSQQNNLRSCVWVRW